MSRCRTCDAEVVWASTAKGKAAIFDAEPDPDGMFVIEGGEARKAGIFDDNLPHYTSHFATCPQADEHRK